MQIPHLERRHRPSVGIPIIIVASFFNAAMATTVKLIVIHTQIPNQLLVFFRFGISFLLMLPLLLFFPKNRPLKKTLKIQIWQPYFIRLMAGLVTIYAYFYAIQNISLSLAVLLTYTSPLFIPIVTWVWRGVPIKPKLWVGLVIGFLGVALIIGPKLEALHLGYFIGLCAGVFAAISYVASRLQSYTEKPIAINFYFFLGASIASFTLSAKSLIAIFPTLSFQTWVMLFFLGLFGTLFQGLVILALKWTQVRYLGAFFYLAVGFAFFLEWLIFNKIPTMRSLLGIGLVILGGVAMALLDPVSEKKREDHTT